jgi:hypothetical protein
MAGGNPAANPACGATVPIQGLDDPGSALAIELRELGWRGGTLQCLPRDMSELQADGTGFYSWLKATLAALALLVASLANLRTPARPKVTVIRPRASAQR